MVNWKTLFFVLLVSLVLTIIYQQVTREKVYELGGIDIPLNQLEALSESFDDNMFNLCEIESGRCIQVARTG